MSEQKTAGLTAGHLAALRELAEDLEQIVQCVSSRDGDATARQHQLAEAVRAALNVLSASPAPSDTEARIRALATEAAELLKHVNVLDCGAHFCRYCPAKSPTWEHSPGCPYEESQRLNTEAGRVRKALLAALGEPKE